MSENFLSRWSKRKLEARELEVTKAVDGLEAQSAQAVPADSVLPQAVPSSPVVQVPELPLPTEADLLAVEQGGNIKAFLVDKVSTELRNKAFKTLFSRPEFNVMDGLDIYIDDYNKFTPLSQEDIAKMTFSKQLLSRPDLELPTVGDIKEGLDTLAMPVPDNEDQTPQVVDTQEKPVDADALADDDVAEPRVIPDGLQALDSESKLAEQSFEKPAQK